MTPASRSGAALVLALAVGCSRPPDPAEPRPGSPDAGATAEALASTSAAASASSVPPPPPLLLDGCSSGIDPELGASARLVVLAEQCIASMDPIWPEPLTFTLDEGASREACFMLEDPRRCIRVLAAADPSVATLDLVLAGPDGLELQHDAVRGPYALVASDGPVCSCRAGTHCISVRATDGAGQIAVQIYRAR